MNSGDFNKIFEELTGNAPLTWQRRLYQQWIADDVTSVIDLPTGLGKTMVMAIWLIARAENPKLGRRLIYVVDRRTVVDQASCLAEKLRDNCEQALGVARPALSTLRGQLADNREWTRNPSKPAIIIGTVDLIGSALLFSGYRSSFKQRPLHAGLLGQDSLLVLDEAHLSKPFEKLITSICSFQSGHGLPMKVIRMSATASGDDGSRFKLEDSDLSDAIVHERFIAKKTISILRITEKQKLNDQLADAAIKLAQNTSLVGKRIVVFVRKPDDARTIAESIRKYESTKSTAGPYVDSVEVLTGTMRGLERDELVKKSAFTDRWLNGSIDPSQESNQAPVFLISTSAGEVGFDLNADHMVCDAAPIESMIQRLGRVNRRGKGDATIQLFIEPPKKEKDGKPKKLEGLDQSIANAIELLRSISDVSPKNIANLKQMTWKEIPDEERKKHKAKTIYDLACSPEPTTIELTDILIDAWSMTSIVEPMPGRPEVAPWVRGIADELPQTTIAWRAELDLLKDEPKPEKAFKAIFAKHRIRPHESLTTNSYRVVEFLKSAAKVKGGRSDFLETRVVVKLSQSIVTKTVQQLINDPRILDADPTLVFPATFGGLDKGMLSHEAIAKEPKPDDAPAAFLDVADHAGYEPRDEQAPRWRIVLERSDGQWKPTPLEYGRLPEKSLADLLNLDDLAASRSAITSALRSKLRLRVKHEIKFDLDDEGDPQKVLLLLTSISQSIKKESQPLDDHIGAVERHASRIADGLNLSPNDPIRQALIFAAKWHDDGKRSPTWQRFIGGPEADGRPRGKSDCYCDPKRLAGYRHEFGSLLRILHPDPAEDRVKPELPKDNAVRDLALHLIIVHHGFGRPHVRTPIDRDFHAPRLIDEVHIESIRRFARLQREYSWWRLAWLENLLRCADVLASAEIRSDTDDQEDDAEETE